MANPLRPDRMADGNPKEAPGAGLKPPYEMTRNRPATYLKLCPESPSLPRPKRPHGGAGRSKREHAMDACLRPGAEPPGRPGQGVVRAPGGLAAQVIDQLAQLIVRAHERDGDKT